MINYVFKDSPMTIKNAKHADPQVFGEALEKIAAEGGGQLKPEAIVAAAQDARHVLHRHFEWDDVLAAASHRLRQAREIVRLVCVVDEQQPDRTPRAFLSVADKGGTSYRSLDTVLNSAHFRDLILQSAERDLKTFETRYRELTDICEIVSEARKKVAKRREKASAGQAAHAA